MILPSLTAPITQIKGVGLAQQKKFEKLGIYTVIFHLDIEIHQTYSI